MTITFSPSLPVVFLFHNKSLYRLFNIFIELDKPTELNETYSKVCMD
jgi:hypothetical protein